MKYEKPDLEEIELILEGSFLKNGTTIEKDPDPWDGEFEE